MFFLLESSAIKEDWCLAMSHSFTLLTLNRNFLSDFREKVAEVLISKKKCCFRADALKNVLWRKSLSQL